MADGVLLMYDVNDALTFSKLSRWLRELRSENDEAEILIGLLNRHITYTPIHK